jgi:hypothetical protein
MLNFYDFFPCFTGQGKLLQFFYPQHRYLLQGIKNNEQGEILEHAFSLYCKSRINGFSLQSHKYVKKGLQKLQPLSYSP